LFDLVAIPRESDDVWMEFLKCKGALLVASVYQTAKQRYKTNLVNYSH